MYVLFAIARVTKNEPDRLDTRLPFGAAESSVLIVPCGDRTYPASDRKGTAP